MASLPHNAETDRLLSSHSDDHYQPTPICASYLPTDFEAHLQPTSFHQRSNPQEKWQALASPLEQPNRLSSSSPFESLVLENSGAPNFARYGDSPSFSDMSYGNWNGKLSHLLACTPMSPFPHGHISDNVSLVEMISSSSSEVAANGESSSMNGFPHTSPLHEKHFGYNVGTVGYTVSPAIDLSKGGPVIRDVSNYAGQAIMNTLPVDTMLAERAAKFSSLNQHPTLFQSAAIQGAANHLTGDARDLTILRVPMGLSTPPSAKTNSPSGLESFQQTAMRDTRRVLNSSPGNAKLDSNFYSNLAALEDPKNVSGKKPPSLPTLVELDGSEGMGKPSDSMDESDGSMGLETSSGCERENGWESASTHVKVSSKKKRLKESSKSNAMQLSDVKDFDTEKFKDKRHKIGDDSNEDESSKKLESNDSDDSMHPSTKETSKPPETPKPDYIHVRARRGQATDSHSLAERIRREKISERMKFLQDLVPGCSKITGKAVMLDEIINYVQSLQRQVEFLSMKLAAVNPRVEFNMDSLFRTDIFQPQAPPQQSSMFSAHHQPSQAPLRIGGHGAVRPLVDVHSLGGSDQVLRGPISTPLTSKKSFGHIVSQASQAWDDELQHLVQMSYAQGRQTPFTSHVLQGQQSTAGPLKPET